MMSDPMDPSRIPDDQWTFEGYSSDGLRRHYVYWIDKAKGLGFRKTENLVEADLLAINQYRRNEADGKRWSQGAGSEKGGNVPLVHVASVPLNKFYREFAPRLKDGDQDFSKWWLNRDENSVFRTRRGRV